MLEFNDVTKIFNSDLLKKPFIALDKVSFEIKPGEVIGFLGANGAGKTTSIKMAMDFIRPSSGQISYHADLGRDKLDAFKRIGYLPERPFFYPHITGREFCHYMGSLSEVSRKSIIEQIQYWGPRLKIDFALDRVIKSYSKGMLQRIGFLATLLHRPKLIILDEPLSGLDPIGRKELKDIITQVNKKGVTVFFSSHIISDVEEVCSEVIFLEKGKLVFNGEVQKIINEHLKMESIVRYIKEGKVLTHKVADNEKRNFIESLIKNNFELVSVTPEKPTLEEIFYKVKSS